MRQFLVLVCCSLATARAGLLNGELSPPTGNTYYKGYGDSFEGGHNQLNAGYDFAAVHGHQSAAIQQTQGGFTPITNSYNHGGFGGGYLSSGTPGLQTTSISHNTQTIPIRVPQPYQVTVQHQVPVPVQVPHPVAVPRPVPIEVLQPYPVHVARPYPVTVAKPVPVPVQHPVYVKVPQAVPVPVAQPYPVHITKPVPVRVPSPVLVDVPIRTGSVSTGFNAEVGYGTGLGLGAYSDKGFVGHHGDSGHFATSGRYNGGGSLHLGGHGGKYTTVHFPSGGFHGYAGGYGYQGGFGGQGASLAGHGASFGGHSASFGGHGASFGGNGASFGGHGASFGGNGASFGGHGASFGGSGASFGAHGHGVGLETRYTHGLHGGLVDSLKGGHYTDSYRIGRPVNDFHHGSGFGGGFSSHHGHGNNLHVNLADITIPQQYDANGGYKY